MSVPLNGKGPVSVQIAFYVVIAVLGLVLYVLGTYRTEASETKALVARVEEGAIDREARIRVLESQYTQINQNLIDIKRVLNQHMDRSLFQEGGYGRTSAPQRTR